jgi:hypothetical protein
MNDKPRNVKNAADVGKDETDDINVMGHPERIVKQPGKPVKRVLNELDPECRDDIEAPIRLQELAMAQSRLSEAVQDHKGVKGDFMTSMGGKTDKLGGKQKNTGAGIEKFGESTSGEATDGITTKLKDLNLKTKQKNTGGTFETQNISAGSADDGITTAIKTMGAELGQNSMQKNKGGQFEPLNGSRDTMGNSVAEEWSLDNIATIMEGDSINLQDLFDSFSKNSSYVCLEDFQQLCNAHGVQTILSEQNLKALMASSRKFMFYEGNDASGRFWQPRPLSEMVGTGAVAATPVAEEDEVPPEVVDEPVPEVAEVPEIPGEEGEIEADMEVEEQPDDLADVFQQIGVDFERAANMMAGHDESAETPEDEAAEGDRPFDEIEGGEEGGEEETAECTEEVCEEAPGEEIGDSAESGGLINKIASGVKGKAASVAMKGREEDEQNAVDPSKEVVKMKVESRKCAKCGTTLDESGCVMCDFLRESSDIGEMNGEDAKADKNGHYTSDKTKKGQGELGKKVPPQETCESTSGAASDGITSEIPGKQTPLKPKMKNTGGQAAFKGGSGTMKENILRLSHVVKEAITRGARKIGRAGKYTVRFGVTAEGSKAVFPTLTDALAVVEELLQVCDSKAVVLEALYSIPHQKEVIHRHRLPLTRIKRRDPIACEGKILFKTGKVASAFADRVVSEGVACRVKNHNWGAAVVGPFSWPIAQRAFQTMSEAWGTQIHTPEREAFHRGYEDQWDDNIGGEVEPELDDEPEYSAGAPGNIDPEGNMCPNCGSVEAPDEHGICYGCGERRAAVEPELELGARQDENLAGSDDYLDFDQGFQQPPRRPMPRRV